VVRLAEGHALSRWVVTASSTRRISVIAGSAGEHGTRLGLRVS
jgi:hypothetical protein